MANYVYATVAHGMSCVKNGSYYKHHRPLQLFSSYGPLQFKVLEILRLRSRSTNEIQYLVVMSDLFSKQPRAEPTTKTSPTQVTKIILDPWNNKFHIPSYVLDDNGPQFVRKCFAIMHGYVGAKPLKTTAYSQQTIGQVEQHNDTTVTSLGHYITDHQRICNIFAQLFTYAYNLQVHRSS